MNISTFYMIYTKKALRERKIPFEIEAPADPFYSEKNMSQLYKSIKQAEQGKVVVKTIAGSGKAGFADGKGLKATFNQPYEIIISEDCKTMYVAGAVNYLIRRITVK